MRSQAIWTEATIASTVPVADDIRRIEFAVERDLPQFEPGSHLTIEVLVRDRPDVRTYTCLPSDASKGRLSIAVKRHENGRGGSRHMWSLAEGARVRLTLPENRFPLSYDAPHYLLLAGGIGITPIYGMALALARRGASLRMLYAARTPAAMAFRDELSAALGDRLELYASSTGRRLDVSAEIGSAPSGTELYVCGPIGLLDAARRAWRDARRPPEAIRFEVFGTGGLMPTEPFDVRVTGFGEPVHVPVGQSMLDALIESGVDMIYDCRRGECGLCAVDILEANGPLDHRDVFFSEEEKRESRKMCTCVSRLAGGSISVDVGFRK